MSGRCWLAATLGLLIGGPVTSERVLRADQVAILALKDNTLYQSQTGASSNGAGQHFFAGFTGVFDQTIRRGLVAFEIAAYVPAGSTIDSATLTLNMSMTNVSSGDQPIDLHRVLADWGEGASNAEGNEGVGTASQVGDATWIHTFFNTSQWAIAGGDFSSTISAGRTVGGVGMYSWGPTPQLSEDVQEWLDNPAANYGWILRGAESVLASAKRFDSREHPIEINRPVLVVDFTPPAFVPGDFDGDGDVDLDDYAAFQPCIRGPLQGSSGGCEFGDLDLDGDVDLPDVGEFQSYFD